MSVIGKYVKGVAAVLQEPDISTDVILPSQFMVTVSRKGLGRGLFFNWRFDHEGEKNPDFVLNQTPFDLSNFLVAGKNFGCGSSREHAVWAIQDFGIHAVIAPSFSQTFATNAAKNGLLAVQFDPATVEEIIDTIRTEPENSMQLSLIDMTIKVGTKSWRFELTKEQVLGLIDGVDDVDLADGFAVQTDAFWRARRIEKSWLNNLVW